MPASLPLVSQYWPRTLAYLSTAAAAACNTYQDAWHLGSVLLACYTLLYPQLVHLLVRDVPAGDDGRRSRCLACLDAINVGLASVILGYSSVPSLINVLILCFSSALSGGMRKVALGLGTALAAALLGAAVLQSVPEPQTPTPVALAALLGMLPYLLLQAARLRKRLQELMQVRHALTQERENAMRLAGNLARYLSPQLWDNLFNDKRNAPPPPPQRKKLTVFFSDIKGFTELSEELEAEALTELLNQYLDEMSRLAHKHGGTLDKFVGDGVMVFFGDPESKGIKRDALAALSMAIDMRKHMKVLRQQWRSRGIRRPLEIRMGLNTGYCTVGSFGSATRMDYTVIGREVNLASRLESAAEPGEILISHETYALIKDTILCCDKGQIPVKGFTRPIQTYQVVDFRRDLGAVSSFIEHEVPGFSMYLDTEGVCRPDKEKVIQALEQAAEQLRDKVIP